MGTPDRGTSVRLAVHSGHRLLRDSLGAYLAALPDITVVGRVADREHLVSLCELRCPDVLVVDAGRRPTEHLDTLRAIGKRFPTVRTVLLYDQLTHDDLAALSTAGLTALVPYSRGLDALLAVLRDQSSTATAAAPTPPPTPPPNPTRTPPPTPPPASPATAGHSGTGTGTIPAPDNGSSTGPGSLTDRQLEIIMLVGSGHSVPEIARLLGISPGTVENHKRRLYSKLAADSGVHAVARATSLGLTAGFVTGRPLRRAGGEVGRPVLAQVFGPTGLAILQVIRTLLLHDVPFILGGSRLTPGRDHWSRWHRGPTVTVLVEPTAEDWRAGGASGSPVVVVARDGTLDRSALATALYRGADAVLPADAVIDRLHPVLVLVSRGYLVLPAGPARPLIHPVPTQSGALPFGRPDVTAREQDILGSIALGHSVRQTAQSLGITAKTVENTQAHLFRKLDVHNRAGALTRAYAFGLLQFPQERPGERPTDPRPDLRPEHRPEHRPAQQAAGGPA